MFGLRDGDPVLLRTASMAASLTESDDYILLTHVTSAVTGTVLLDEAIPFSNGLQPIRNI